VELVRIPLLAVVVALMVGVAACDAEPEPRPTPSVTTPTATPTPTPLSTQAYQVLLTDSERAVRRGLDRVMAARTLREVDAARLALAEVMETKATALQTIVPPPRVATAHRDAAYVLSQYDDLRKYDQATTHAEPNACGVASPTDAQVIAAKKQIYWRIRAGGLEDITARFDQAGLTWGEHLLPPEPDSPPPAPDRRARNGQVVERNGERGPGRLRITNNTADDAVIAVVTGDDASNPQAAIYVRAGASAALTGLSRTYSVYFKSGSDWDARRQSFTSGCRYETFVHPFTSKLDYAIEVRTSAAGSALTKPVPPF
jgi:hypothetical protein